MTYETRERLNHIAVIIFIYGMGFVSGIIVMYGMMKMKGVVP
jgi:hypothetical protein